MRVFRCVAGVFIGVLLVCLVLSPKAVWGAKLILRDGTTIEGTVTRSGDEYTVKTADGNTQTVQVSDVRSFEFDTAKPEVKTDAKPADSAGSLPASASGAAATPGASGDVSPAFRAAKNHANEVDAALAAVAIWQEYVDKHSDASDLPAAQAELSRWKVLAKDNAEKINGKWIGGDERKKIIEQADALTRQGIEMYNHNESIKAVEKLQESAKVYPNAYLPPFVLGRLAFDQHNFDSALQYYQTAVKLKPQAVEAINNLAVAQGFKNRWDIAIESFEQAAEIHDNKIIAQNLINAIDSAPPNVRALKRLKPTFESAHLLATKYQLSGKTDVFMLMPIPPAKARATEEAPTSVWSGTGFFINGDGLIITNRHVVKGSKTLMVTRGGEEMSAEIKVIDDEQDLALIQVKLKSPATFIHLATENLPHEGADCIVMGYPLPDRLQSDIKVTRGIVSSSADAFENGADVLTDAKVNPGNSGGPILDKYGNAIAVVSMKSLASATEDSYGIGISSGHVRDFLKKNKITVAAADAHPTALSTEDVVVKAKPATVWILATK